VQLHDPDGFELKQALQAFEKGNLMLHEICNDLGIRPGPVYDEYVKRLKESKEPPSAHSVRVDVEKHAGFDRIYNDLPLMVKTILTLYPQCYIYELADYEPLPDTEWVIFLVPRLGFVKLYTSLFYDLGCYVEVTFPEPRNRRSAKDLATLLAQELNEFYRTRVQKDASLSHG